jgi:hypothetical protein
MNITNTKSIAHNGGRSRGLYVLSAFVFASFVLYLFFIGQTVGRLVAEKNMVNENRALATEISEFELEALSLNDSVSIERAYELGFVNAKSTQYVAKKSPLTLR